MIWEPCDGICGCGAQCGLDSRHKNQKNIDCACDFLGCDMDEKDVYAYIERNVKEALQRFIGEVSTPDTEKMMRAELKEHMSEYFEIFKPHLDVDVKQDTLDPTMYHISIVKRYNSP